MGKRDRKGGRNRAKGQFRFRTWPWPGPAGSWGAPGAPPGDEGARLLSPCQLMVPDGCTRGRQLWAGRRGASGSPESAPWKLRASRQQNLGGGGKAQVPSASLRVQGRTPTGSTPPPPPWGSREGKVQSPLEGAAAPTENKSGENGHWVGRHDSTCRTTESPDDHRWPPRSGQGEAGGHSRPGVGRAPFPHPSHPLGEPPPRPQTPPLPTQRPRFLPP